MSDVCDWDMVACARAGDLEAFGRLVRRYQGPVMHFCQRMAGSAQDAEDLAQETFLRVYRHLNRIRPDAQFSTLLFRIARNLTLNYLRDARKRGRGQTDPLDAHPGVASRAMAPDAAANARETGCLLARGLANLPAKHREVLVLRELNGFDYDAIARIVGCRKGTVKSRLARARENLRIQFIELGGEHL